MNTCPLCGSEKIYRSQSRSLFERARKRFTARRPHRCHDCGWRGWNHESAESQVDLLSDSAEDQESRKPDLNALDTILTRKSSGTPRSFDATKQPADT